MAISKEDIKPLAWSADDEPTFLKDDEKKDGKNGNVAGSVDTVLRARRTFKMKKGSGGRKKQSWKALNTRWVRARDEMFVNERFLEKVLQVMGRMRFGVKNSMLIVLQNEKATRIATAASWRGLGVQLLPGAEAKPIWLDAGADTQRKTIVPSKWYDITQTDAGEKLTLKGTIYNTLAICRITLNQIDELKIVEQQGVTGIHYDREVHAYIAEQYRRVYAIGSTREELKPPIGRVHLIDADRIDMPGEVSYHAVENSKLSKPDVMELLQYPIGVTLEADGRYRVFLGAYRVWYLRECLHWTKIPCYVYKIKRQIRDPRERRRREIHRRQQAAESPRIRLQLYENYYKLLKGMKDAGEIKGGLQTRLMQLLGVSERTVRIYKQLSEQLTGREKQHLMRGKLPFVQARAVAAERNQKAAMLPDFEEVEDNKDKNLPANNGE